MVKQWKKHGEADELLRKLVSKREIDMTWKNDKETHDYWSKHAVFKDYSHGVFTGYYKGYVQG